MGAFYKVLVTLLLLSAVNARPTVDESELESINYARQLESADNPNLYLIIAEAADESDDNEASSPLVDGIEDTDVEVAKRSAEEADEDDLETAAGTNVLRPLFVYRQQLAYRERVKKGVRRFGIRPRF